MRKYPDAPWKEDKIKCVVIMKTHDSEGKEIKKDIIRVFVTKDVDKRMTSEDIQKNLPVEKRFKYNLVPDIKMSIPRRVFNQLLNNPDIATYFTTPLDMGKGNFLDYDFITKISKELWYDPDNRPQGLYFNSGRFISVERK